MHHLRAAGGHCRIQTKKNMATKRKYPPTADRVGIFTAAWREIAAEASFARMTLAEFESKRSTDGRRAVLAGGA
jgi:hypothetical protein